MEFCKRLSCVGFAAARPRTPHSRPRLRCGFYRGISFRLSINFSGAISSNQSDRLLGLQEELFGLKIAGSSRGFKVFTCSGLEMRWKRPGTSPIRSFPSAFSAEGMAARSEAKPPIMMALVSRSRLDRQRVVFSRFFDCNPQRFVYSKTTIGVPKATTLKR
jgi:hypothetical protein